MSRGTAAFLVLACAFAPRIQGHPRSPLFERVVVLGASVSMGERGPSPSILLAQWAGTRPDHLWVYARGGARSRSFERALDEVVGLKPTLILALDLFYHDFKFSLFLSEGQKRYLRHYVKTLCSTGAPVLLGTVPKLVLLRYEHANRFLRQLSSEFANLILVDVNPLLEAVDRGHPVRVDGVTYRLRKSDVFLDRVHPNPLGSRLLAGHMLDVLRRTYPRETSRLSFPTLAPSRVAGEGH
ncbi:MAG: SGNH/GDSL hydrolase family protein [Acidobacteria bacterium]|nr:SGNH/GDSL hydrolase family protein [Acidobacteriota bacterium]